MPVKIACILAIGAMGTMAYMQRDPFFPKFLKEHRLSKSILGYNMATYSASMIVATIATGNFLLKYVSRMNTLFLGSVMCIIYYYYSAILDYMHDREFIKSSSFISSVVGGIGNGFTSTAIMAMICNYPTNR